MSTTIALLLHQPMLEEHLRAVLARAGYEVTASCRTRSELVSTLSPSRVQVAIVCVPASDPARSDALSAMEWLRDERPDTTVVVVSPDEQGQIPSEAMRRGAAAFICTADASSSDLLAAVRVAERGEIRMTTETMARQGGLQAAPPVRDPSGRCGHLTGRERQVLASVAMGYDNLKIASLLHIGERTVKSHVSALYRKLAVENRVELALLARQLGVSSVVAAQPPLHSL